MSDFRLVPDEGVRATWWSGVTPGSTYWRCLLPARYLPGQVLVFSQADVIEKSEGVYEFPWQRGTAIWQFVGNITRATMAATMQEQGTKVLMEVDDNYLVHTGHYGIEGAWGEFMLGGEDYDSVEAHRGYVPWFDGIICSTPHLAEEYSKFNDNVHLCPNSIDPEDWHEQKKPDDGILRIGWIASGSHSVDAPIVKRALKWASEQPNVEVVMLGHKLFRGFKYDFIPWTDDLDKYRKSVSILDVGICPLQDNIWTRGKSDIKAMEYAMSGAMPIVQRVEPYRPWFDRTIAVNSRNDWEAALRWCVYHRDEVKARAAEAKEYVLAERTIQDNVAKWEAAL